MNYLHVLKTRSSDKFSKAKIEKTERARKKQKNDAFKKTQQCATFEIFSLLIVTPFITKIAPSSKNQKKKD